MSKNKVELMLERTFLMDPNVYMTVVMTLEGDVMPEELCEAVKKAYTRNAMTMSKAVLDERGTFYMEEMDETGCKVFVDNRDWQEILHENECKPFRVDEGELARTFIIPKEKETDIFFMVHHITCDGNGILIFAEDVLNILQGKEVAYRTSNVMTKKGVIKKGNLNFLEKLGLKKLSEKWCEEEKAVFGWDTYYKIHEEFWKEHKTNITLKEVEGSELEEIKATCKNLGVTVNSYMVTKFMKEFQYQGRQKLAIPTSIRKNDRSISCMVSSVIAHAEYDYDASFEKNLVKINKILRKEIKNIRTVYYIPQFVAYSEGTLIDASFVQHFIGYESNRADRMRQILGLYGDGRTKLGVTNLGVLSIPRKYDGFKIKNIIPIAPNVATSEKVITVSTFKGKMLVADSSIVKK